MQNQNSKRFTIVLALLVALVTLSLGALFAGSETSTGKDKMEKGKYNPLTPQEEAVIINKGTESPFTGKYYKYAEDGTYLCKRCGAKLFESGDKFDAGCGWPSFDDAIPGAVKEQTDADGRRTEIVCANCGAHLGHVFRGEGFTDKDTRHCVNSISLSFAPAGAEATAPINAMMTSARVDTSRAYFAGGCFWGTEYFLQQEPGVISTSVGYMGGHTDQPTYKTVCDGHTGHAETVEVLFDPSQTSYEKLARLFFEIHDPTQYNRQGPDMGDQYRSAVFYVDDNQKMVTEKLINELKENGYKVVTQVAHADKFWPAEDYHQDYYAKSGHLPYCHVPTKRFKS